jgi:hypothetical protein
MGLGDVLKAAVPFRCGSHLPQFVTAPNEHDADSVSRCEVEVSRWKAGVARHVACT